MKTIGLVISRPAGFAASPAYWDWIKNLLPAICVTGFIELIVMLSVYSFFESAWQKPEVYRAYIEDFCHVLSRK